MTLDDETRKRMDEISDKLFKPMDAHAEVSKGAIGFRAIEWIMKLQDMLYEMYGYVPEYFQQKHFAELSTDPDYGHPDRYAARGVQYSQCLSTGTAEPRADQDQEPSQDGDKT